MTFVLTATAHGPMIVNTNDAVATGPDQGYGVSLQLLNRGCYDPVLVGNTVELFKLIHRYRDRQVIALDGGANLGVFTLELARALKRECHVIAVEPQRRIFQALCGNIALGNLPNVTTLWLALNDVMGTDDVWLPDYDQTGSFGSLSLMRNRGNDTGQTIDGTHRERLVFTSVDLLFGGDAGPNENCICGGLLDLLKLDVEGMELEALKGATATVRRNHPVVLVEHLKTGPDTLAFWLEEEGYVVRDLGRDLLAIHEADSILWDHLSEWRW